MIKLITVGTTQRFWTMLFYCRYTPPILAFRAREVKNFLNVARDHGIDVVQTLFTQVVIGADFFALLNALLSFTPTINGMIILKSTCAVVDNLPEPVVTDESPNARLGNSNNAASSFMKNLQKSIQDYRQSKYQFGRLSYAYVSSWPHDPLETL